jgi:hypothetical protein
VCPDLMRNLHFKTMAVHFYRAPCQCIFYPLILRARKYEYFPLITQWFLGMAVVGRNMLQDDSCDFESLCSLLFVSPLILILLCIEKRRYKQTGAPCTVELGYNVMKGTEYFVSL